MRRRRIPILPSLSLLLALILFIVWLAIYFHHPIDLLPRLPIGPYRASFCADQSTLYFEIDRPIILHPARLTDLTPAQQQFIQNATYHEHKFLAFGVIHGDVVTRNLLSSIPFINSADHTFAIGLPIALILPALCLSPFLLYLHHRNQKRRRAKNLCPTCAYDLRVQFSSQHSQFSISPNCPECGTPIPPPF